MSSRDNSRLRGLVERLTSGLTRAADVVQQVRAANRPSVDRPSGGKWGRLGRMLGGGQRRGGSAEVNRPDAAQAPANSPELEKLMRSMSKIYDHLPPRLQAQYRLELEQAARVMDAELREATGSIPPHAKRGSPDAIDAALEQQAAAKLRKRIDDALADLVPREPSSPGVLSDLVEDSLGPTADAMSGVADALETADDRPAAAGPAPPPKEAPGRPDPAPSADSFTPGDLRTFDPSPERGALHIEPEPIHVASERLDTPAARSRRPASAASPDDAGETEEIIDIEISEDVGEGPAVEAPAPASEQPTRRPPRPGPRLSPGGI
jgi:hypothetical protein